MGYRLREIEADCKFSQELKLEVIEEVVLLSTIKAVLESEGCREKWERKLNMAVTVLFFIVMHLHSHLAMGAAMRKASQGLRYIWPKPDAEFAGESALSYRRYQLGARPCVQPSTLTASALFMRWRLCAMPLPNSR